MHITLNMKDIHFPYGKVNGNANRAKHTYQETFLNRRIPDRRVFIEIRFIENGSFSHQQRSSHSITFRTPQLEEATLEKTTKLLAFCLKYVKSKVYV